MVYKKCREQPEDILFIDASQHYEKVKTQNVLRQEDIDKIIDTYRNRIEEKKYSIRASLKEIADDDYNLNIPRYVDTFEVEDSIDINHICELLDELNELSKITDNKIKSICYELNINAPTGNNVSLLKKYKKGILQKILSQELKFKDENGEVFPDWEKKNGNLIFRNISNKDHNSDLPILAITQEFGAIPRNLIEFNISVTDKSVESYKVVEIGDFIISLRTFQGGIEYSNYKGICSPAYIILRPFIEINNLFFKFYFKTEAYIKLLQKNLEGIRDGKMISYKYFSEIELPYPCIEEQTKIANFLSAIDEKINHCGMQIEKTEGWKKGVLQKMFV